MAPLYEEYADDRRNRHYKWIRSKMVVRRKLLLSLTVVALLTIALCLRRPSVAFGRPWEKGWDVSTPWLSSIHHSSSLPPQASSPSPPPTHDNYTRLLIIPTLKDSDIAWFDAELPSHDKIVYVANDPAAPNHPPKNKGNEVMIYLTYIIDHYDALPDISIFLHAHRHTWHNNDLLDNDAAQMLRRLNPARVTREGYMNLRCEWDPGCPHWLHPKSDEVHPRKQEQLIIAKAWGELFPLDPLPNGLSQTCCAQFAVSREAVRRLPVARYVWFRDWVLRTELSNYMSGRVFEYLWQYMFTGREEVCPSQHACYCDGYGVCFAGPAAFQKWFELRWRMNGKKEELHKWEEMKKDFDETRANGTYEKLHEDKRPIKPESGRNDILMGEIEEMRQEMADQKTIALRRGMDPNIRAMESGREWKEGDGF